MRCNKQELFALASQTSQNFDREGALILTERQDSFFRRSEGCSLRWFRLRGNLLFYLKGPEPWYEPLGLIVLGNHQVSAQTQDDNGHWPFQLVWENGVCYRLATYLETERSLWLKAMAAAPYEHLTLRIADLHRQLSDTRTLIDLRKYRAMNKLVYDFNEVPLCEVSLACDNLLCDANGNPPSPFAAAFVIFPEKDICLRYCSTEIVERCSNPCFSRTMMFRASDNVASDALVRIVVYNIRETITATGASIGSVALRLNHIQEAQRLRLPLLTVDEKIVGFMTINGWSLEPSHAGACPSHANAERNSIELIPKIFCHRRSQSLPPRLGLKLKYPSYGTLIRQNFMNPHQATYRFQSGLGGDITVHEAIAEPRICFTMPLQLVEIYMKREKEQLETMLAFAEIAKRVPPCQFDLVSTHLSVMRLLQSAKKVMLKYSTYFKPSTMKEDTDLAFVPVNLHLQRMWVHNETLNKTGFHDVVTVGAFSAHSHHPDKAGGLIKLVQQCKDIYSQKAEMMANTNRLDAEFEKLRAMVGLRKVVIAHMNKALLLLQASRFTEAKLAAEDIRSTVKSIFELWDGDACEEALSKIGWNKKRIDKEVHALTFANELVTKARRVAALKGAASASAPEGVAGASSPEGAAGASAPEGAAGAYVSEGAVSIFTPESDAGVLAHEGVLVIFPPEDAAGAFSPEGAAGVCSQEVATVDSSPEVTTGVFSLDSAANVDSSLNASALATLGASVAPGAALSIKAALEAVLSAPEELSASEGARVVLAAMSVSDATASAEPLPSASSSTSSVDNPATSDMACGLSSSVPDMQKNTTELQFHADHFTSELADNSARSGGGLSGKNNRNGKNRNGKKGGWNKSFKSRGARPKVADAPPKPVESHDSPRTDFKTSASLEQVSFKSLVNNKKAEKKKAKKNRRDRERLLHSTEIDPEIRSYNKIFFEEVTSANEDMLGNVLLSLDTIIEKGSCTESELDDTKIVMDLLIKLLDEMQKWASVGHTAMRIDSETAAWTLEHATLQIRRDICFSQALTTATAGLMCWLSSVPSELAAKIIQSGLGPLCGFEGLLSLYAPETTMWGDMVVAIEDLHTVLFKLVKVTSGSPTMPQVTGNRNALVVELPVSDALYARFEKCQAKPTFTVTAVFFNIGINDKASIAEALNEHKPQDYSNSDNLERLQKYYLTYCKIFPCDPMDPLRVPPRGKSLEEVMENLRTAVLRRSSKNVEVLHMAALATRLMHGIRFTSCKSAKDRTGMSVTLEQVAILSSDYHLGDFDRKRALDTMRSEGCRRENTAKNIGFSKYAFTRKQVLSLPEEYRPPPGSYGATLT